MAGWKFKLIIALVIGAIIVGAAYYSSVSERKANAAVARTSDSDSLDRYYTVKKGDLVIGINLTGNANAQKKHKMGLEAAFSTKLLWIIDESSKVKKGDSLAKFETEELLNKIEDLKTDLDNVEKEIMIAIEEQKILKSTNKASIRSALDNVTEAEEAFRRYHKFERGKERDKLDFAIQKAKKASEDAQDKYREKSNELQNKSFDEKKDEDKAKSDLETFLNEKEKTNTDYENANLDRKVFKRYTLPNKLTDLDNKLEQAKLNLQKTKIEIASRLVQKDKSINNLKDRQKRYIKDLKKFESFVPMMELKSPVGGVVIYGDPDRRRGTIDIKIGMDLRRRQILVTIPDMSNLVINFQLPEQFRSKVMAGDKAIITPDSIEGLKLTGKVKEIGHLPVNQIHWDRNSPKIYRSVIELDKQNPRLVSGTSVQIEIVTKILKNVLSVPVESVFEERGRYFVFLSNTSKPTRKDVSIGLSNDNSVQIIEGLKDGDVVCLYRPFKSSQDN